MNAAAVEIEPMAGPLALAASALTTEPQSPHGISIQLIATNSI